MSLCMNKAQPCREQSSRRGEKTIPATGQRPDPLKNGNFGVALQPFWGQG